MSSHILVTGGAGYIGCVLVPKLLEKGYAVRVLDKLVFGGEGLDPVKDRIELVPGDVRRIPEKVLDGIDAVVHLAGLSNDPTAEFNPAANESINTEGTLALAGRCKEAGVRRFVFASSCSVYYTMEADDTVRDEDYPIHPQAPYSYSKHNAEKGLLALADGGLCPVILRKGTVFGPSPRMRYDLVVNTFVKDAFQKRHLTIHAGGRMWRPLLHIEDAAYAYVAVLEAPEEHVRGQVFNVLSDNYQVIKVAYEVRRALESQRGVHLHLEVQQVGAVRSYRVAGDKFKRTLGMTLDRSITSATPRMWDELEEGIDPDAPIYYNIRWLEVLTDMQKRLRDMGGGPL
jgi:nucleoside-diphosphate-sugar epimerase